MMDNKPLLPASVEPAEQSGDPNDPGSNRPALVPSESAVANDRREPPWRDALVGPNGIHPGARWLIYLAMAFVVFELEGWLLMPLRSHMSGLWFLMAIEISMMLAAILPAFVMARIEDRPFGDFGLPRRQAFGRNFWIGTLWGIASLSVLILALRIVGAFEFGSLALHGARILKFAFFYAVLFLVTGFFEDFLVRGYSQWILSRAMHFWPAAAVLSIAFGYIHAANPGEQTTGLVAAGWIGFFLCLTLRRTGNLWWAVGFHMAWDWGESFLFSVPDSGARLPGHLLKSSFHGPDWLTGGSVGPEGSYLVFVVIGALWVLFDRVYPVATYGTPPPIAPVGQRH
jgi:membrane protease YdiL (CAAX protease family)